jgi:putative colanic acid biosynthesis UDP-glucose lipid carrier transferase
MKFRQKKLPNAALVVSLTDILIIIGSGYLSAVFKFGFGFTLNPQYYYLMFPCLLIFLIAALFGGVYTSWKGVRLSVIINRYSYAVAITVTLVLGLLVFSKSAESISRVWLASTILFIYFSGIVVRAIYYVAIQRFRYKGYNVDSVFVVYAKGANVIKFDDKAIVEAGYQVDIKYQLDPTDKDYSCLLAAIKQQGSYELWLAIPIEQTGLIKDIMHALRFEPINIRLLPDFGEQMLLNTKPRQLGNNIALDLSCTSLEGKDVAQKRIFDIVISLGILFVIWPLMLAITVAIKTTSRGQITFKQQRDGLYGKTFWVYKFRSMAVHAENNSSVTQAKKNDSRITKVGAFLRQTSLDELPQFINVLLGSMSIVGPRPHALAHNDYYKSQVEAYMWRNKVKPGITGWAQINGFRGETDTIEKMEKRIEYDLWYMENWSLWWDVKIFLKTFLSGFSDKNAY